jgi:hypothetical protein
MRQKDASRLDSHKIICLYEIVNPVYIRSNWFGSFLHIFSLVEWENKQKLSEDLIKISICSTSQVFH